MARTKSPHILGSLLLFASSMILTGWILYLLFALPTSYHASHWDMAWVGFDLGVLSTLLGTSWAMWKRRQAAIPGAMISATLLVVDSWFDGVTANAGNDFKFAVASALFVQLPAAGFLFKFSRKAMRKSIENAHTQAGKIFASTSLWKTPLTIFEDETN